SLFAKTNKMAVLSRGYKRKTTGYREVFENSAPTETGDEPLQIKRKFPQATVAVCKDRRTGIEILQKTAGVIVLDDAFQHRRVKPKVSILLTDYSKLFVNDYMLPTGNLREPRSGAKRADVIVVTKCPPHLLYAELQKTGALLPLRSNQRLYFSRIRYGKQFVGKTETKPLAHLKAKPFTLVTGIADPSPMVLFLREMKFQFTHKKYPDHHNFSDKEIEQLKKEHLLITTEKDYVRLQPKLKGHALYYLPIKTEIVRQQAGAFKDRIKNLIER
ncbi:MAG: tetraacyldisaccharide 4'-kinase, partial [Marinirhabdus sp.]